MEILKTKNNQGNLKKKNKEGGGLFYQILRHYYTSLIKLYHMYIYLRQ